MKTMTKVIAVIMMMTITTTASAKSHNDKYNGIAIKIEVGHKPHSNYDRSWHGKPASLHARPHNHISGAMHTFTFQVSRHTAMNKNVVLRANSLHGVKVESWNPRTRMLTVSYNDRITNRAEIVRMME
ncbi:MAG: hypothetical protein J5610_00695 [Prevotella sp.]|nr:hypothetical protein [Prevotella sp.]